MDNPLMHRDTPDQFVRVLLAWRLWLAGAVLGALVGAAWYAIAPPPYRAEATVIVDMNLEEAWEYFTDRQLFQFMERESRKLEALAWHEDVLSTVADRVDGVAVEQLLNGKLTLSQPADGAWHFWADDPDPDVAVSLAGSWASAFADEAVASQSASNELIALRQKIDAEFMGSNEPDQEVLESYFQDMAALLQDADGIQPYTEISVIAAQHLPVQRAVPQAMFLLGGSALGVLTAGLLGLWLPNITKRND